MSIDLTGMARGRGGGLGLPKFFTAPRLGVLLLISLLSGCGDGSSGPSSYSIGATVSGLAGSGLTLQLNATNNLSVSANGSVSFPTQITSGSAYKVTVLTQPTSPAQVCTVTSGSGTVAQANVTVAVACVTTTYTIGVSVSGLSGSGLVLQLNGADNLAIAASGKATFSTGLIPGTQYAVTILTQPSAPAQACAVSNGSGAVAAANITSVSIACPVIYKGSASDWTWVNGSSVPQSVSVYGTQGVATALNVPGSRAYSATWTDSSGNLWLFGGACYTPAVANGLCNDLWKYTPALGVWTWVNGPSSQNASGVYGTRGTASATNVPGARNLAVSWIDASNNLWLLGGNGYDSTGTAGDLNDLWKYNPTTGMWTWVSGSNLANALSAYGSQGVASPSNMPGARDSAVSWTDHSGNFWFFGGCQPLAGNNACYNDLWEYNPTTGNWTWVSGSSSAYAAGVYGTLGVPSAANVPGSRNNANSWTDAAGNFWLFGGNGSDSTGEINYGDLNDLWKYSPTTGLWTWVGGSEVRGAAGIYGVQGVASSTNQPGARVYAISWTDSSGNLWLYGGFVYIQPPTCPTTQGCNYLGPAFYYGNDLWEYSPTTGMWVWVGGSNQAESVVANYGTLGVSSPTNMPGSRSHSATWADSSGNLWLFGGTSYVNSEPNVFNDLWVYTPNPE